MTHKKYKLLKKEVFISPVSGWGKGNWYRVKALIDIPLHNVKAGDIGGYVQSRKNLSQKDSCWIGEDAFVANNAFISENAYVGDNAQVIGGRSDNRVKNIYVQGNTVIRGNAKVFRTETSHTWDSHLSGNIEIKENAAVIDIRSIKGNVIISDNAKIESSIIDGESHISGLAIVESSNVTDSTISGSAIVHKSATLNGTTVSGEAQIGENQSFRGGFFNKPGVFYNKNAALPKIIVDQDFNLTVKALDGIENPHEISASKEELNDDFSEIDLFYEIKGKIELYETDITKIIRYPAMTDRTDHYTVKMTTAFNQASRLSGNSESLNFKTCVHDLEEKFLAAESNAIKISSSLLSKDQLRKSAKAKDLFSIASDEAAGEHERKVAFIQGFKQLEGVVTVPEIAVDAFRVKLGFKELNM